MKRRLNLFQAMMLRWRELYPYSAVHTLRVSTTLDVGRLEHAIAGTLEARGLTGLEIDIRRRCYVWQGGPATQRVHVVAAAGHPGEALDHEMERQLNMPFAADGSVDPFRFFAVGGASSFHLGLAYDHVVAGGDSIARLLKSIAERYDDASRPVTQPPSPYAPTYAKLFWRERRAFLGGLGTLPKLAADCRCAVRPRYASAEDGYNGFIRFRIDPLGHAALTRAAAAWQVSLQDLFLAMTLLGLSPLSPGRTNASRRREIAVASIVNIRGELGSEAAHAFGPCLASFRVAHPVPAESSLRELALAVRAQKERIKQRKLYLQTLLAMAVAGLEWRFLSREQRARFFAKHYPVWAGVTPLNLNPIWSEEGENRGPPEYIRAVSTGPLAPMIVALTSGGSTINAGISFRTTVYSREAVERLAAGMLDSIARLEQWAA